MQEKEEIVMLTDQELLQFCEELKFSVKALAEIRRICSQGPLQGVRSIGDNLSGHYPSCKMTSRLQYESRRIELPFIYQIEQDDNVLDQYDQPSFY